MATCDEAGVYYVKNDQAGLSFNGTVVLEELPFADGSLTRPHTEKVSLGVVAGVSNYFAPVTVLYERIHAKGQ